jgi:heptosyltransferase-2
MVTMHSFSNSTSPSPRLEVLVWTQTSFLGDIVLTTGALALARKWFPTTKQVMITTPVGKALLAGEPFLDDIVVFDKTGGGFAAMRAVKRALAAVDPTRSVHLQVHKSFRSSLLAYYLGLPTITYRQSAFSWLAQETVERIAVMHEAVRIGLLLEPLGVPRSEIVGIRPSLHNPSPVSIRTRRLVGVAPGSVWGTKRWPKEKFAELVAGLLDEDRELEVALIGSEAEREQADFIAQKLSSNRLVNLAGRTTLGDLKAIIASLDLLVTNDSSPIHFASAFDTPTLAIFGATIPELGFGPLARSNAIAEVALACRPCSDHGPQVCPLGHFKCMNDLQPKAVLALCRKLLTNS